MKILKYYFHGVPVGLTWNEANEEFAKREADGGEYTVEEAPDNEAGVTTE